MNHKSHVRASGIPVGSPARDPDFWPLLRFDAAYRIEAGPIANGHRTGIEFKQNFEREMQ